MKLPTVFPSSQRAESILWWDLPHMVKYPGRFSMASKFLKGSITADFLITFCIYLVIYPLILSLFFGGYITWKRLSFL